MHVLPYAASVWVGADGYRTRDFEVDPAEPPAGPITVTVTVTVTLEREER